jgi:hypothetical protein
MGSQHGTLLASAFLVLMPLFPPKPALLGRVSSSYCVRGLILP